MKKPFLMSLLAGLALTLSVAVLAAPGHEGGNGHGSGHGGHHDQAQDQGASHSNGGHHGSSAIGKPGQAAEASRTIEVVMYDNYYEPEELRIAAGETVRFVVKNEGMLVHEFNLGTAAMHAAHQDEMMMMVEHGVIQGDRIDREMMNMDMGGGKTMAHDEPNSVLLEPGESAELVWTFSESAEIEFACNIPGHYDAGMQGQIEI